MKAILTMLESALNKVFPTRVWFPDRSWIEFFNKEAILYGEENGHSMEIVWYFQRWPKEGRLLRVSDIDHWEPPHEAEQLSRNKRDEIQQKIIKYCNERGIALSIVAE